jgi:hypothetical protein
MSQSPFVSTRRTHPIATHGIHTVPTFAAGWIRKGGGDVAVRNPSHRLPAKARRTTRGQPVAAWPTGRREHASLTSRRKPGRTGKGASGARSSRLRAIASSKNDSKQRAKSTLPLSCEWCRQPTVGVFRSIFQSYFRSRLRLAAVRLCCREGIDCAFRGHETARAQGKTSGEQTGGVFVGCWHQRQTACSRLFRLAAYRQQVSVQPAIAQPSHPPTSELESVLRVVDQAELSSSRRSIVRQ